jgi:hypothetical protein
MRYSPNEKENIVSFMRDNPNMTLMEYMNILCCGKTVLTKLREDYGFTPRKVKALSKAKREEISLFIMNNPTMTCNDVAVEFGCSSERILSIRSEYGIAKRRDSSETIQSKTMEAVEYMRNNPHVTFPTLREMFGLSKKRLRLIRKKYSLPPMYESFIKHKRDNANNPQRIRQGKIFRTIDGIDTIVHWLYDEEQAELSFKRINSLPRSLISISKLVKNGNYLSPEREEEIVTHMINFPDDDYSRLVELFKVSLQVLQRLRGRHKFKPIKKQFVKSFQNLLLLEGKRRCPTCGETKDISEWYTNNPGTCKSCERKRGPSKLRQKQKNDVSSLEKFLKKKLGESRQRKNLPGEHTITYSDLIEKYVSQNGLCFYSGRPLVIALRSESENSLSIDRIDSTQNYTKDNIVLCCSIINIMKLNHSKEIFLNACRDITNHTNRQYQECYQI